VPVPEGKVSIRFQQIIARGDVVLTEGEVRVACVDSKTFPSAGSARFHQSPRSTQRR
jgi:acyl-CoA thioesterase FadM